MRQQNRAHESLRAEYTYLHQRGADLWLAAVPWPADDLIDLLSIVKEVKYGELPAIDLRPLRFSISKYHLLASVTSVPGEHVREACRTIIVGDEPDCLSGKDGPKCRIVSNVAQSPS